MKISSFPNKVSSFFCKNNSNNKKSKPLSFKSIYVQDSANIGDISAGNYPPVFLQKDALLLNEIAQQYPNQDCFIKKGFEDLPKLEYRERPPQVQIFSANLAKQYSSSIDPNDKDYPSIPLILYGDSIINRIIGVNSYISLNPSLAYTVKAGYELHKKIIEKKYQIMDVIGKTDYFDIGEESVMEKSHKSVEDIELAVTRYLMESSYSALTDRADASQIYASNYPIVQTRLDNNRRYDLVTSVAKRPVLDPEKMTSKKTDICEYAMQRYPNMEENRKRIQEISDYLLNNGLLLG